VLCGFETEFGADPAALVAHAPCERLGLGIAAAQLGFQQVHGLDEGRLLAGGELVEDAGDRARRAVEPFVDQGGLGRRRWRREKINTWRSR
jgi:hypothetical protein